MSWVGVARFAGAVATAAISLAGDAGAGSTPRRAAGRLLVDGGGRTAPVPGGATAGSPSIVGAVVRGLADARGPASATGRFAFERAIGMGGASALTNRSRGAGRVGLWLSRDTAGAGAAAVPAVLVVTGDAALRGTESAARVSDCAGVSAEAADWSANGAVLDGALLAAGAATVSTTWSIGATAAAERCTRTGGATLAASLAK
jgi:hypothetical protein